MAFDLDELLPSKPVKKPLDLNTLSVGDLQDYIVALEAEIARAQATIQEKQHVHAAAQAFFKR